jgi:chorismate mutase
MDTKKTQRISETKCWLIGMTNNIYKTSAKVTKRKREKTQINKIRDENEDIPTDTNGIQRVIREYTENLYFNKLENLEKWINFLMYMTYLN